MRMLILYGALDVLLYHMGFGGDHWQYWAVNALTITIMTVSSLEVRKSMENL